MSAGGLGTLEEEFRTKLLAFMYQKQCINSRNIALLLIISSGKVKLHNIEAVIRLSAVINNTSEYAQIQTKLLLHRKKDTERGKPLVACR